MSRKKIKLLIQFAPNVEAADAIVENEGFLAVREKIAFIKGLFDISIMGRHDTIGISEADRDIMDYYAILDAIINGRWED